MRFIWNIIQIYSIDLVNQLQFAHDRYSIPFNEDKGRIIKRN